MKEGSTQNDLEWEEHWGRSDFKDNSFNISELLVSLLLKEFRGKTFKTSSTSNIV